MTLLYLNVFLQDLTGSCVEKAFDCFGVGDDYVRTVYNDFDDAFGYTWFSNDAMMGVSEGQLHLISPEPDGTCAIIDQVGVVSDDMISVFYNIENVHTTDLYTIELHVRRDKDGELNETNIIRRCNDTFEYVDYDLIDTIGGFDG